MSHPADPRSVAFVGDVHLDAGDPALPDFLSFLARLGQRCGRVVLMGDLFNLWIARPEFEQAHHRAVLEQLIELRRAGVVVRYLEGNRDYRTARHVGDALDDTTDRGLVERAGDVSVFAIHGDLANPLDRQYRSWRRLSRSAPLWWLVRLLPRGRRLALAHTMESRMRSTNLDFKQEFPEELVLDYAARFLRRGNDVVVLGHFHVERDLASPVGRVLVLPEWRESRRHLELHPSGSLEFVDSDVAGGA